LPGALWEQYAKVAGVSNDQMLGEAAVYYPTGASHLPLQCCPIH
jgi:hypothetical protein